MNKKDFGIHLTLILIGTLCYFFANFQRIAIPGTIFDILQAELSLTAPYITAFGAIFMYIYAFNQLIIGVLVDKYGGFRVMLTGGVILGLGMLFFPITDNLILMYLSRAFIGLGSSTFYLSMIKELKVIFSDKNYGIAISVMLFIGYSGGIIANAPFVFLMKSMSWREILIGFALIVLSATLIFFIILTGKTLPPVNKNIKVRMLPFRLVLHKRHNRNLFSFACCNYGICYAIQTVIGKKFLEDFCLMPAAKAAVILSGMALIGAVFNVVNAAVCKIFHNRRVKFLKKAAVITFCSLLCIFICLVFEIRTDFIAVIFCILAANASLTSILVPVLHLTNRKMVSTTAVSIMNFCFFTMVGILGTATGFLLNIHKPIVNSDGTHIYSTSSYLLVFGIFFALSFFELYKAMKLSEKY